MIPPFPLASTIPAALLPVLEAAAPVAVPVALPPVAEAADMEEAADADDTAEPFGALLPPTMPPAGETFCVALAAFAMYRARVSLVEFGLREGWVC